MLTSDSGSVAVLEDGFTYLEASNIDDVSPDNGQFGTSVIISGTNLLGKGEPATDEIVLAKLGDAEATVESSNSTYVVLTATNNTAGDVDVVLEATSEPSLYLPTDLTTLNSETLRASSLLKVK